MEVEEPDLIPLKRRMRRPQLYERGDVRQQACLSRVRDACPLYWNLLLRVLVEKVKVMDVGERRVGPLQQKLVFVDAVGQIHRVNIPLPPIGK